MEDRTTGVDDGTAGDAGDVWQLTLYVAGRTPRSVAALDNLKRICAEHLAGSYRVEVVDLLERLAPRLHLVVDTVEVLGPAGDLRLDAVEGQLRLDRRPEALDVLLPLLPGHRHLVADGAVRLRLEELEAAVLQLPADARQSEAVRQGGVHVQGLARDAPLGVRFHVLERPHVVQPVHHLDQDDPDVAHHGQQHLAVGLRLPRFPALEGEPVDLGDPVDEGRDRLAEAPHHLVVGDRRVLDDVVEQARGDGHLVHAQLGEQAGDLDAVLEVGPSGAPQLAFVLLAREVVGARDQAEVRLFVAGGDLDQEHLQLQVLVGLLQGRVQVGRRRAQPGCRPGGAAAAGRRRHGGTGKRRWRRFGHGGLMTQWRHAQTGDAGRGPDREDLQCRIY